MIGPLLALVLGGAQAAAPVQETWTWPTLQLARAVVVAPEAAEAPSRPAAAEAHAPAGSGKAEPAPVASELMPAQLEKAVVRPAL